MPGVRLLPDPRVSATGRRLRACADVVLGAAWYARESREGWPGIPLGAAGASIAARAAPLGPVPGAVAAAAFAAVEPGRVERAVDAAWLVTTPQALVDARRDAAIGALAALLGDEPPGMDRAAAILRGAVADLPVGGHPVYAGLRRLPWPGTPLGDLWRACDIVRERRNESHVHAWASRGLDPVEVHVLSELRRGIPVGTVARLQMGWSAEEVADALDRLRARGLVHGAEPRLTSRGRQLREDVELATDLQEQVLVDALGDEDDVLVDLLDPYVRRVAAAATGSPG